MSATRCLYMHIMFFLKRRQKLCLISLIKKSFEIHDRPSMDGLNSKVYSRGIRELKCLAPANPQSLASVLILDVITYGMEDTFLNTLAFRSFQISHETNMTTDARPFLTLPLMPTMWCHQSLTLSKLLQFVMSTPVKPIQVLISVHTLTVEPSLKEEVGRLLFNLLAKRARDTVWPIPLGQPVHGPNPVLHGQTSKKN